MTKHRGRPILFLDIDDVMCLMKPYSGFDVHHWSKGMHAKGDAVAHQIFAPTACQALLDLHAALDGQLRFVITSTWRLHFDRDVLCRLFELSGLACVADSLAAEAEETWCTPRRLDGGVRSEEIEWWLEEHHRGEAIAVVDDVISGPSLRSVHRTPGHPLAGRVVLCEERVGLTPEGVAHLLPMLRRRQRAVSSKGDVWR